MITSYKAAPDIDVLTTNFPIPGLGQLAINAFVLHGDVPVLVDTDPVVERESFMTALKSVIDPADLRWKWRPTGWCPYCNLTPRTYQA